MIKYPVILSFDPGTTCTGWAISEYRVNKPKPFIVKECGNFSPVKDSRSHRKLIPIYGQQEISLFTLEASVKELITTYKPTLVVSEDTFNKKFLSTYVSLKLCIHTITSVCMIYGIPFYKYLPKVVKKIVTGRGDADKNTIQDTVIHHPHIKFSRATLINKLIEHEADAIAIGYTLCHDLYINRSL